MAAIGPDFRAGFMPIPAPVSNADISSATLAHILAAI